MNFHLYLKLENMQQMGSYKVRGIANQMESVKQKGNIDTLHLVTMSAGKMHTVLSSVNVNTSCLSGLSYYFSICS